jgi:hypothetical protein
LSINEEIKKNTYGLNPIFLSHSAELVKTGESGGGFSTFPRNIFYGASRQVGFNRIFFDLLNHAESIKKYFKPQDLEPIVENNYLLMLKKKINISRDEAEGSDVIHVINLNGFRYPPKFFLKLDLLNFLLVLN